MEHMDYTLTYNTAVDEMLPLVIIAVHSSESSSVIQYIAPINKFASAVEIVAIDEAAAIPLPVVRTHAPNPMIDL
jgi:tRNA(Met) C34 N-acetyltransferase TmcA